MATLHVRNVPDQLYETLRVTAELEGRSIGAETIALLKRGLEENATLRKQIGARFGRRIGHPFLKDARRAVVAAQDEVRSLGHDEVGTEHLLLGLLRAHEGPAPWALEAPPLGITFDAVRERVIALRGRGDTVPPGRIPFAAAAKQALELALREALSMKDRYIGAHHVLLGIAGVEDALGAQVLRDLGADRDTLRAVLVQKLARMPESIYASPPSGEPDVELEYRAVALTGSAEDWTASLNELAIDGWELVSIVGEGSEPRAVFRRPASEGD